jgi:hypothetical protein
MTGSLCEAFQALSGQTADRLIAAHKSGMRWSEETNTEHILLTLRAQFPSQVAVESFSRRREAVNGADWEWWFLGRTGAYGMRVQAKRIKLPNEIFTHLRHRPKGHSRDQMTSLIDEAVKDGMTPAYCFYVASKHLPVHGCLIGHAQLIQQARSYRLRELMHCLVPWHRLVCGAVQDADICETAAQAMIDASGPSSALIDTSSQKSASTKLTASHPVPFLAGRDRPAPEYVMDLARELDATGGGWTTAYTVAEHLPDEVEAHEGRRTRGIVVFRGSGH